MSRPSNLTQATSYLKAIQAARGIDISLQDLEQDKPKGRKILGLPWWLVAGAGGLLLFGGTGAVVKIIGKKMALKTGLKTWQASLEAAGSKHGVPADVIALFISLESGFDVMAYNPEPGQMASWACQIAGDARWRVNPDFSNAVGVCKMLKENPGRLDALAKGSKKVPYKDKLWKFGSFGLGQISAITARGLGFSHARSNEDLFIPEVNIDLVAKLLAKLKKQIYPGRPTLSMNEWSRVRAAYVGGPGILKTGPTKVAEIASRFLDKAKELAA